MMIPDICRPKVCGEWIPASQSKIRLSIKPDIIGDIAIFRP
jgi:hypothetical protein